MNGQWKNNTFMQIHTDICTFFISLFIIVKFYNILKLLLFSHLLFQHISVYLSFSKFFSLMSVFYVHFPHIFPATACAYEVLYLRNFVLFCFEIKWIGDMCVLTLYNMLCVSVWKYFQCLLAHLDAHCSVELCVVYEEQTCTTNIFLEDIDDDTYN